MVIESNWQNRKKKKKKLTDTLMLIFLLRKKEASENLLSRGFVNLKNKMSCPLTLSVPSRFSAEKKKKFSFRKFYGYFSFYAKEKI